MAKIKNIENILKMSNVLNTLASEATRLEGEFNKLYRVRENYGLADEQVLAKVDSLDVNGVQDRFNEVVAVFTSNTKIEEPTGE